MRRSASTACLYRAEHRQVYSHRRTAARSRSLSRVISKSSATIPPPEIRALPEHLFIYVSFSQAQNKRRPCDATSDVTQLCTPPSCSASGQVGSRHAAIHHQSMAVDIGCGRGGEEKRRPGDL